MTSKWHRRTTKYVSIKIEVGTYARVRALALSRGVTRGKMLDLLLDHYDRGLIELKAEAVPETAKVVPVRFEED